jgi:hypothetical protein
LKLLAGFACFTSLLFALCVLAPLGIELLNSTIARKPERLNGANIRRRFKAVRQGMAGSLSIGRALPPGCSEEHLERVLNFGRHGTNWKKDIRTNSAPGIHSIQRKWIFAIKN